MMPGDGLITFWSNFELFSLYKVKIMKNLRPIFLAILTFKDYYFDLGQIGLKTIENHTILLELPKSSADKV